MLRSEMNDEDRLSSVKKTHKFVKALDHEVFGRIYIYLHYGTDSLLIMKEKLANNLEHMRTEEALIEKREMLRHPNLMVIKDWSVTKESKICAEFYNIRIWYMYTVDNAELLAKRYIKSYLQSQGFNHGFIRPELFAREANGTFILSDRLLEGKAIDSQRYAFQTGLDLYCSPIVYRKLVSSSLQSSKTETEISNPFMDDAFSFGLVLLRLATLQSLREIYQESGIINQAKLNNLIEKAADRYDHIILFRQLLEKLLDVEQKHRTDAITLKAAMPSRAQMKQYFLRTEQDEFFDGPQSRIHNQTLGKESIYPSMPNRQAYAADRSDLGADSIVLSNISSDSINRPIRVQGPMQRNNMRAGNPQNRLGELPSSLDGDELNMTVFRKNAAQTNTNPDNNYNKRQPDYPAPNNNPHFSNTFDEPSMTMSQGNQKYPGPSRPQPAAPNPNQYQNQPPYQPAPVKQDPQYNFVPPSPSRPNPPNQPPPSRPQPNYGPANPMNPAAPQTPGQYRPEEPQRKLPPPQYRTQTHNEPPIQNRIPLQPANEPPRPQPQYPGQMPQPVQRSNQPAQYPQAPLRTGNTFTPAHY